MKTVKYFFAISLLFLAAVVTFARTGDDTVSLHWKYSLADSMLTFTGNGAMPDYKSVC